MIKKFQKYYQSVGKLNALFFLSGILLGLLVYFYSESSYEDKIFAVLASDVIKESTDITDDGMDTVKLVKSLHLIHNSLKNRQGLFYGINGVKAKFIRPLTVDLMTAEGDCGSYAMVLARLLKELNYDVRMIMMKVDGEFGGHILVEAKNKDGWITLDPSFDLYFKRIDGNLASFEDVQENWDFYKAQVPGNYDMKYRYEDKRYTNWEKIPVLMPLLKKVLNWTIGAEKADTFSLRTIMLRKFYIFFTVTLVLMFFVLGNMVYYLYKKQRVKNIVVPSAEQSLEIPTTKTIVRVVKVNSQNSIESRQN